MTLHNYTPIGGKTCNGIDDETRGIQLSYLNDDSNGWIQIAYFSDTQLFRVSSASVFMYHIVYQVPTVQCITTYQEFIIYIL